MWRLQRNNLPEPKFECETCVICLDRKHTPHYLGCGHSFCKKCITTYIAEFEKKVNAKCPLCRKQIYNREPFKILQRPPNNFLVFGFVLAAIIFYSYERGKCVA